MERKKASDFPQGLLDLFDAYVHGGISRRAFLEGAERFAVGGLGVAALFEMLRACLIIGRRGRSPVRSTRCCW
jgi:carboxymethylenebutenolidase